LHSVKILSATKIHKKQYKIDIFKEKMIFLYFFVYCCQVVQQARGVWRKRGITSRGEFFAEKKK
jgi:hypothetical protein